VALDDEVRREVFLTFKGLARGVPPQSAETEAQAKGTEIAWRMWEAAARVLEEEEKRE
jgi:hypothetical protein